VIAEPTFPGAAQLIVTLVFEIIKVNGEDITLGIAADLAFNSVELA
jgi:hypothetical protein